MGRLAEGAGIGWGAGAGASSGTPSSRIEGSEGNGPSIAHRRDSYFDRMNDSILLYNIVSKEDAKIISAIIILLRRNMTSFQVSFPVKIGTTVPPFFHILYVRYGIAEMYIMSTKRRTCICSVVQESKSTDFTLLMCVPMLR